MIINCEFRDDHGNRSEVIIDINEHTGETLVQTAHMPKSPDSFQKARGKICAHWVALLLTDAIARESTSRPEIIPS